MTDPISRARHIFAAAAFVLSSASVFAQGLPSAPVRRLSVDEAVRLALEQNLGIRIERLNPQIQDIAVAQARSLWAPQVSSTLSRNSTNQPNASVLSGNQSSVTSGQFFGSATIAERLPWGANYTATWSNLRNTTSDISNIFNPYLRSQVQFSYVQPLMRDFKIDNVRQQLENSQIARETADIGLNATIVQTTRSVKNAYWDLVFAIDNLTAQRQSLDLATRLRGDNEKRVQIGTMAPIDIVEAQSEVARNEEAVIVAEAAIEQAEDVLRTLIFDPVMPDFWTVAIEPTDPSPFQAQAIDVDAAVRSALDRRTDLRQAKQSLAGSDVNLRYFDNQVLPDVNAQVNYSTVGIAGVELERRFGAGGLTTGGVRAERSYGAALGDVLRSNYPTWSVAVSIGYPLGTSTQEANRARARLQYQKARTELQNLELRVAAEVREAARRVQTNQKRVESARVARALAEQRLEAEEKKFAAGIQTSFFVFQGQRDLAQARTNEVRATSDYNKSLVDFEAVQEVGSVGGVTTAGAGAIATGDAIIRQ